MQTVVSSYTFSLKFLHEFLRNVEPRALFHCYTPACLIVIFCARVHIICSSSPISRIVMFAVSMSVSLLFSSSVSKQFSITLIEALTFWTKLCFGWYSNLLQHQNSLLSIFFLLSIAFFLPAYTNLVTIKSIKHIL